jgi:hypothetical protein
MQESTQSREEMVRFTRCLGEETSQVVVLDSF